MVGTVQAAANPSDNGSNPCVAQWADFTTPVQFQWGAGAGSRPPTMNPVLLNPSVTATTAAFSFNTFKPNVTVTVYYGTAAPAACDLNNPQPPNCMQPFRTSATRPCLARNRYRSTTIRVAQHQTAVSQGVPNVYDAGVTITGLTPNTTYHWRTLATDASAIWRRITIRPSPRHNDRRPDPWRGLTICALKLMGPTPTPIQAAPPVARN